MGLRALGRLLAGGGLSAGKRPGGGRGAGNMVSLCRQPAGGRRKLDAAAAGGGRPVRPLRPRAPGSRSGWAGRPRVAFPVGNRSFCHTGKGAPPAAEGQVRFQGAGVGRKDPLHPTGRIRGFVAEKCNTSGYFTKRIPKIYGLFTNSGDLPPPGGETGFSEEVRKEAGEEPSGPKGHPVCHKGIDAVGPDLLRRGGRRQEPAVEGGLGGDDGELQQQVGQGEGPGPRAIAAQAEQQVQGELCGEVDRQKDPELPFSRKPKSSATAISAATVRTKRAASAVTSCR